MDRWDALVATAHRRLSLRRLLVAIERNPKLLEEDMATPKLQGVRQAMALLRHNLELDAEKLSGAIVEVDTERTAVFAAAHEEIAATKGEIADVKAFLADIKGSNGSPTSGGSSTPPAAPVAPVPTPASDQVEQLTVNGISKDV